MWTLFILARFHTPATRTIGQLSHFLSPTVLRTEGDLQVDHLCVCMFLTTLLLVNTTDTGFSLVDFNEALEM